MNGLRKIPIRERQYIAIDIKIGVFVANEIAFIVYPHWEHPLNLHLQNLEIIRMLPFVVSEQRAFEHFSIAL